MSLAFDTLYYLQNNPDVAVAVARGLVKSAEEHYKKYGWAEFRNPNASFDTKYYISNNVDVSLAIASGAITDPFSHFSQHGVAEGRAPTAALAAFSATAYFNANPDVKAAWKGSALQHYLQFGAAEGRAALDASGKPIGGGSNPGGTYTLTDAGGVVTGSTGDDTFIGARGQGDVNVVQGGNGNDRLNLTVDRSSDNGAALRLQSVEQVYIRNIEAAAGGGVTLDLSDSTGVISVWNDRSTSAVAGDVLTVKGISTETKIGVNRTGGHTTVQFTDTAGSSTAMSLALNQATGGTVTANGVETFKVTTEGADSSSITLAGNSLASVVVEGAKDLNLNTLPSTLTSISAQAFTGKLSAKINAATDLSTATSALVITGGSNSDTFDLSALAAAKGLDALNSKAAVSINGGAGTDTVVVNANGINDRFKAVVKDVETLRVSAAANATINGDHLVGTGVSTVEFRNTANNKNVEANNLVAGVAVAINTTDIDVDTQSIGTVIVAVKGASTGKSDSLTLNLNGVQTAANKTDALAQIGNITVDHIETLKIVTTSSNTGGVKTVITDANAMTKLELSGAGVLDLTVNEVGGDEDLPTVIDGSAATGAVKLTVKADLLDGEISKIQGGASAKDEFVVGTLVNETLTADISGFETVTLTMGNNTAATFDLAEVTGASVINVDGGGDGGEKLTIRSVTSAVTVEVSDSLDATGELLLRGLTSKDTANVLLSTADFTGLLSTQRIGTLNIETADVTQTIAALAEDTTTVLSKIVVTGDQDLTVTAKLDNQVKTIDLSAFEAKATLTLGDAGTRVIFGADNTGSDITAGNGSDTFVFASALEVAMDIADFAAGGGITADVLNLAALGVKSLSQLTFTFNAGAGGAGTGDEVITITSSLFDGSIKLTGTYTAAADLAASNFVFG